ncbi:MAG: LysR family transcriptional regulator [Pseudomonadota bacterium]
MITPNLPLGAVRSFVHVAETGSVTAAGERLGRSQPAISLQIKKLEALLGRSLFVRDNKQLRLNEDGRVFLDYAHRLLALNDEALSHFLSPRIGGIVRFGIPSEFASSILPRVIGRFRRVYPQVTLEVTSDLSQHLLRGYRQQEFDMILALHDEPGSSRTTISAHVHDDELVWVGYADVLDEQTTIPLVVAPKGCIYRQRIAKRLDHREHTWNIVYTNPDVSGIKTAIEERIGITALARSTVPPGLPILTNSGLPDLGSISVSILYKRNVRNSALIRLEEEVRKSLA